MKILGPSSGVESAEKMINAGVDEIYIGGDEELFLSFSFTGRGKLSQNNCKVACSSKDIKRVVEMAHYRNVKVNFLCNIPFFYNGEMKGNRLEHCFLKYAEMGVDSGVDALVVGDLGLLYTVSKQRYPVKIHSSVYFRTLNRQQILFLKEFGVNRVTLSYHVTSEEIDILCAAGKLEIEVIGYLGCSFFNGACSFLHDLGEGVINDFEPGIACKGVYNTVCGDKKEKGRIFDTEKGCAICSLGRLEKAGVYALKIVGRDRDYKRTAEVVELYRKFLDYYRSGVEPEHMKHELPVWWRKLWCSGKRCKYKNDNPDNLFVIGGCQ